MDSIDIRYFRKNAAMYMHLNIYLFKYVFQAINRYRLYGIEYRHRKLSMCYSSNAQLKLSRTGDENSYCEL